MRTYGGAEALDLGDFLAQLEQCLDTMTATELRLALVKLAERLPAFEREGFLGIFEAGPEAPADPSLRAYDGNADLLPDIDAFSDQFGNADDDDSGWEDSEHADLDDSWVEEMDELFARTDEVFQAGNMAPARDRYGRLLDEFFAWADPAKVRTGLREAAARRPARRAGFRCRDARTLPAAHSFRRELGAAAGRSSLLQAAAPRR